jgi:dihydropteroate synthase
MQAAPHYDDVVAEVAAFLRERVDAARAAGIADARIWLDPGIGFGKRREDNLRLLSDLRALVALGFPVVIGASRKRFLASGFDDAADDRLAASLAAATLAAAHGAKVVRVHDVAATRRAVAIADAVRAATRPGR